MKAIVAIVGRPNVGKSTLFNCLVGEKIAIVSNIAGTTRDRIYSKVSLPKLDVIMADTGGLEYGKKENIEADVRTQALIAMEEADLIMFVVDGSAGLTASDDEVVKELRKKKKDVILVANKVDRKIAADMIPELYKCGFGDPIEIAAEHGRNIDTLKSIVEKKLREKGFRKEIEKTSKTLQIAIVGRPNVGKSSMFNALTGQKKVIVSNIPGTTRDAIDTEITFKGEKMTLVDTAGLRRRGKIGKELEYWSSLRGLRALERCDVAVLVVDAVEDVVSQDEHIAGFIMEEKKGLIIAINKIDQIEDEGDRELLMRRLQYKMSFLPWAPIVLTSALTGENVTQLLSLASEIKKERQKKIDPKDIKELMQEATLYHLPKGKGFLDAKIISAKQVLTNPPRIIITVNDPELIHFSYRRYLERKIRERYGFMGTALDIRFEKYRGKNWKDEA
jgi:GTP-binding protein